MTADASLRRVRRQTAVAARHVERVAKPAAEPLARAGYATRGLLYFLVGILAAQVATGDGGKTTDTSGAIATLAAQPHGQVLLALTAAGLAAYALWGLLRATVQPRRCRSRLGEWVMRASYLITFLWYGFLVIPTVRSLFGHVSDHDAARRAWTATLLATPFGTWALVLVGLGMAGFALTQVHEAWTARFREEFRQWQMRGGQLAWATVLGRIGHAARGLVYLLSAWFIVHAALAHDADQATGLDGALQSLQQQPHGPWLLGAAALGLMAFGVYSLACARWSRTQAL